MFEKKTVYWIAASTGCSCCSYENFDYGFFFDKEEPQAIIDRWSKGDRNPLASQYAKYGRYSLMEGEAEILPDGRMIVEGSVFDPQDYPEHLYW